jgi:hypothetical protein
MARIWLLLVGMMAPALAVAQREDVPVPYDASWGWGWFWIGLAAVFLIALFAVWVPGRRRRIR